MCVCVCVCVCVEEKKSANNNNQKGAFFIFGMNEDYFDGFKECWKGGFGRYCEQWEGGISLQVTYFDCYCP